MLKLMPSIGVEESKIVSDKQMISKSLTFMYPSKREREREREKEREQLGHLNSNGKTMTKLLPGPRLDSISSGFSKRKFLM